MANLFLVERASKSRFLCSMNRKSSEGFIGMSPVRPFAVEWLVSYCTFRLQVKHHSKILSNFVAGIPEPRRAKKQYTRRDLLLQGEGRSSGQ